MVTECALEVLNAAYEAFLRDDSARNESRLFSAAVDAGMPIQAASVADWAAERVAAWLVSAPLAEVA